MPDPVAYLTALHGAALDAVATGDEYVTQTNGESGGNTAERNIPSATLLEICEAGLQILEAEAKAASGIFEQPGSVRYADFHENPCLLG